VLLLLFGVNKVYVNERAGEGNVSAFIMISVSLYGAALATTAGGAMVSIERAAGWSRQLRLTPLTPVAYIVVKMLTAMVLGLVSVIVVFAFGLFLGYLLPTENVMQFLGIIMALLSFAGGLFIPLSQFPKVIATL